ncbi:MAG: glycoside hydrolase family 36 protein [Bacteroidota bacterium]
MLTSCGPDNGEIVAVIDAWPSAGNLIAETEHTDAGDGIRYYDVQIVNSGTEDASLKEISFCYSHVMRVDSDAGILAGGSEQGREWVERHARSGENIDSKMFLLVKNGDHDFTLLGVLSWKEFLPVVSYHNDSIMVSADADGKIIKAGEKQNFEKLVMIHGDHWQTLLDHYAREIAMENGINGTKEIEYRGWSTWDYYGRNFTLEDIVQNIEAIEKIDSGINLIQIDGGWWTERGDYLSVRPDLKGGMKGIADYITGRGYTAGIHLDGFRADLASCVAKEHPDYFLKDQNGEIIVKQIVKPDGLMNLVYFDYSHPGACDYIKNVLATMKDQWGFGYFKIDFMRYGLKDNILRDNPGVTEIEAYNQGLTHVERFRRGISAMKEALGDEVYFLGCSAVFGPAIGFVDGMRTGADISPGYEYFKSRALENAGNYYLHKTVFNNDADYMVFRSREDEDDRVQKLSHKRGGDVTLNEAGMWADYTSLFGNAKLSSDNLLILRDERKELIRSAFSMHSCDEFVPLDLWQRASSREDACTFFLGRQGDHIYLALFNWEERGREFTISGFPESKRQSLVQIKEPVELDIDSGALHVELGPHSSALFRYRGNAGYPVLRRSLKIEYE